MNIQFFVPECFLEEENRIGYIVTAQMKKVWAVQLDLLIKFQNTCKKYGLTYFADSGTLLGAIRHGGYIPWDDDIDIVMKRSDYDRLVEIGADEFKYPYFLQNAHSDFFPRGYARLRNSDTTAINKSDLGKDFNHGIFIDIFPLDNVPDDEHVKEKWLYKISLLHRIIKTGFYRNRKEYFGTIQSIKYYAYRLVCIIFGYNKLINCYEDLCRKYNHVLTQKISYVAYSKGKEKHIWDRTCFDSSHEVPFEFTVIKIPDGYDSRLKVEYHDYMTMIHASTAHGTMVFDPDMPYKEYLKRHTDNEILEEINKMEM